MTHSIEATSVLTQGGVLQVLLGHLEARDVVNMARTCNLFRHAFLDSSVWRVQLLDSHLCGDLAQTDASIAQSGGSAFRAYFKALDTSRIICDCCHSVITQPPFFRCLHCCRVHLCHVCEARDNSHPRTHILLKSYSMAPAPILWSIPALAFPGVCRVCEKPFKVGAVVFTRKTSPNESLCAKCRNKPMFASAAYWAVAHPPEELHPPERVGENPRSAWCNVHGPDCLSGCRGVNWKCTVCWAFDLCEPCEAMHNHDPTHLLAKLYWVDAAMYHGKWDHAMEHNATMPMPPPGFLEQFVRNAENGPGHFEPDSEPEEGQETGDENEEQQHRRHRQNCII